MNGLSENLKRRTGRFGWSGNIRKVSVMRWKRKREQTDECVTTIHFVCVWWRLTQHKWTPIVVVVRNWIDTEGENPPGWNYNHSYAVVEFRNQYNNSYNATYYIRVTCAFGLLVGSLSDIANIADNRRAVAHPHGIAESHFLNCPLCSI